MKSFKQFISEGKTTEITSMGGKELHDHFGKKNNSVFKALINHPIFRDKHTRNVYTNTPNHYTHNEISDFMHKVTVHSSPYLTDFYISKGKRGPSRVTAYHHMIATKENPNHFETIKTHGIER